jgi:hypothetical protein
MQGSDALLTAPQGACGAERAGRARVLTACRPAFLAVVNWIIGLTSRAATAAGNSWRSNMDPWLKGAILGGIAGGLAGLVVALLAPRRKCPDCGMQMPHFRKPASRKQALWGGWTCPQCGCEIDRRGKKVERT